MDAFLKVITVNFKMHIAPGVVQDIKGHMYTSLCDTGPVCSRAHRIFIVVLWSLSFARK